MDWFNDWYEEEHEDDYDKSSRFEVPPSKKSSRIRRRDYIKNRDNKKFII